jgi:transcriptional regulator with XRE-family HTH domain
MFDDRLACLRKAKGISMRQCANELGIPYTTYVSYEKNERDPKSEQLIELADYFNVSIDYLLGRTKEQKVNKEVSNSLVLTKHEEQVLTSYRNKTEMQNAVDTLLNVPSLIEVKSVARSSDYHKPYKETITAEQLELLQSQEQPSSDDDL